MRVLRLPGVQDKTGLKRSEIYDLMAEGKFPGTIPLGIRAVGWIEAEVDNWIAERVAARDSRPRIVR